VESDQDEQREVWMAAARDQELRLILDEERAERRVARARTRLDRAHRRQEKAERRVDRQFRRVKEAEAELAACQQRRALGPAPPTKADAGNPELESAAEESEAVNSSSDANIDK